MAVAVSVVIDELALVFVLGIRDLESGNALCRVDDIITSNRKPPHL